MTEVSKEITAVELEAQPVHIEPEVIPTFESNDPALRTYFHEHGYVAVRDVLSPADIEVSKRNLWDFLEKSAGIMRSQPNTWTKENLEKIGVPDNGILRHGAGQSEFLWHLRLQPKVKEAFRTIFETDDLIASMDGGNIFFPWHAPGKENTRTSSGWFHVDQGSELRGFHCVQGIITLLDCNEATGGFSLIPDSTRSHDDLMEVAGRPVNFVSVPASFPALQQRQILPCYPAGALILWDSRTIHCSTPALVRPRGPPDQLLRMIAYVCMVPRKWASEEVIANRVEAYERDMSLYHWPHLITHTIPDGLPIVRSVADASPEIRQLIGISPLP